MQQGESYRWAFGGGGLLFVLVGAVFVVMAIRRITRERRFTTRARAATGVVVAINARETIGNDYSRTILFFPVVRFTAATGEDITFENPIGSAPALVRVGQPVAVTYDPANLRDARLASGWFRYGVAVIFLILGVGLALFGALLLAIQSFIGRLP